MCPKSSVKEEERKGNSVESKKNITKKCTGIVKWIMGLDIPQHSDQGIKMQHKINTCAKVVCDSWG